MTENFVFIRGRYNAADAADILLSLLNDKIKFHTVRSLNLRYGEPDSDGPSEARIKELKEAKKLVERLVLMSHNKGLILEINSTIEIKLLDCHDSRS